LSKCGVYVFAVRGNEYRVRFRVGDVRDVDGGCRIHVEWFGGDGGEGGGEYRQCGQKQYSVWIREFVLMTTTSY
jgi:hypothetical protein